MHTCNTQGDQVKKGEVLGAIEQLGTIVDVKVGVSSTGTHHHPYADSCVAGGSAMQGRVYDFTVCELIFTLCCHVYFCVLQSPQEGEIVAFKVADGDPVEYGGPIVALAPFFNLEDAGKTSLRSLH